MRGRTASERPGFRLQTPPSALLLLCLLGWGGAATAHQSGVSSARIDVAGTTVTVELAVAGRDLDRALGTEIVDPETDLVRPDRLAGEAGRVVDHLLAGAAVSSEDGALCTASRAAPEADEDGIALTVVWSCSGETGLVWRNRLFIADDPLAIQHVLVLIGDDAEQDLLTSEHDRVRLTAPRPTALAVFTRYARAGAEQAFSGYDHAAFLVALLIWARRPRPAMAAFIAFSAAYSIAFAPAARGIVAVPAGVVAPLIAASVIWAAVEAFLSRPLAWRWIAVLAFGLAHGFGFAGDLRAFGMPSDGVGLALAAFNVGVVIGLLAIAAVVASLMIAVGRLGGGRERPVVKGLSGAVAALGLYWLLARTLFA